MLQGPSLVGLGEDLEVFSHPAIVSCPPCSLFVNGTCVVCENGDPHPGCAGCVNGAMPPPPWYKRDLFISVGVGMIASISAAIMIAQLKKQLRHIRLL